MEKNREDDINKQNKYIKNTLRWFSIKDDQNFVTLYRRIYKELSLKKCIFQARVDGDSSRNRYRELINKYGYFPSETLKDYKTLIFMAKEFFAGAPIWKSPLLQYNLGTTTNTGANVFYAMSHEININNVNNECSGNVLAAEKAVCRALASLAGSDINKATGLFTFGGTATNLYGIKIGITKNIPTSKKMGMKANIKIAITEDSHFSHSTCLNWLGVGQSNAIILDANINDRTTNLGLAKEKLKKFLNDGYIIPVIVINGGTTYNHTIDNIAGFVKLRNELVKEYKLQYIPHIHVDSVVGWSYLLFKNYNFEKNELRIEQETLVKLKKQADKIK